MLDPLEKLAAQNQKHEETLKKEKNYKGYLFSLIILFIYFSSVYVYLTYEDNLNFSKLYEMTISIWLFSMVITCGIGAVAFSSGLSLLLWVNIFAKKVGAKVSSFASTLISLLSLSICVLFFFLAIFLNIVITENNRAIHEFLMLGFQEPPFILKSIINFVTVLIVFTIINILLFIWSMPFSAKKDAGEYIREQSKN